MHVAYRPPKIGTLSCLRGILLCIIGKFQGGATVIVLLAVLSGSVSGPAILGQTLSDEAHISVLTMLPGKDLYSAWGHTAIRIADPATGLDDAYNYGTFDFGQPNFYTRFLIGRLDYQLAVDTYGRTLRYYNISERSVIEQHLRLSSAEKQQIYNILALNYLPENRAYRYDFFFDNCATRPRDVLEQALNHRGRMGEDLVAEETFRTLTVRAAGNRPWTALGLDLLLSLPSDRIAEGRERLFLPDEVLVALDGSIAGSGVGPLVVRKDTVLWFPPIESTLWRPARPVYVLWFLALIMLVVSWRNRNLGTPRWLRWIDAVLASLIGLTGCIMLLMWIASDHVVLKPNMNLLWAWPTHLFAAIGLIGERHKRLGVWYGKLFALVGMLTLASWYVLPQSLPSALIPLVLVLSIRFYLRSRDSYEKPVQTAKT